MKLVPNYIGGTTVESEQLFKKYSPVTGETIAEVCEADEATVDHAVREAQNAWPAWNQLGSESRAEILERAAQIIEDKADDFIAAEVADIGRPKAQVRAGHVMRSAEVFRLYAREERTWTHDSYQGRASSPNIRPEDSPSFQSTTVRHPKGVVGVIAPWNVPLLLLVLHVAPAIAAGNAVVAKPSEESPQTAVLLAKAFTEAGMPPGVFNVVHGFGSQSAGEFLVNHPGVNAFGFTGDSHTGEIIMAGAAKGLRDVLLELGGKNIGIVFEDADIEKAALTAAMASFTNTGQVCLTVEKFYVASNVFDDFLKKFVAATEVLTLGRPTDDGVALGPLISKKHQARVKDYIQGALDDGAELVHGGKIPTFGDERDGGYFFEPTILTGLKETAPFMKEEVFGPVCHVSSFSDEQEIVELDHNSPYGLASVLFTQNMARAQRLGQSLQNGINWINCWQVRDLRSPLQGFGRSGVGKQGGRESLDFYSNVSTVTSTF